MVSAGRLERGPQSRGDAGLRGPRRAPSALSSRSADPAERQFYEEFVARALRRRAHPLLLAQPAAYSSSLIHSVSHFPVREITAELSLARKS